MSGSGVGLGAANAATGVALLPNTGDNNALFVVAVSLLVSGVAIFVASAIVARKSRNEAN